MKRCWFGAAALAALLIFGVLSSRWMENHHGAVAAHIDRAADAAAREDWDTALAEAALARQRWAAGRGFAAVLADHAPMEEVDALLALLGPGAEPAAFRENCLRLSRALSALGGSQSLSWANLF